MISLRSQLRRKLLTYFYVNRSSRAYVRQLARELNVDSTNLSRELARLEQEGLLKSEIEGRQTYYTINPQYPFLKPVFALLQGTIGIRPSITDALKREINYTVLTPHELKRKLAARDAFLTDVWKGKRIQLINHEQDQAAAS